ncbi:coiled-coil domain-containing protein 167 isoform X2 [Chanodichthys erythropterus]|uniref:coiled-coil domain-containing protein 167 isoform X2 n=1 Tax=Chanodichthys erythropterus TaxID=933992 RepID=UPI00351E8F90
MSKSRTTKKEKISVASEIDRIEERKLHCKNNLERAEFRQRKHQLSDSDRLALEDEMTIMNERIQKYAPFRNPRTLYRKLQYKTNKRSCRY